MDEKLTPQQAQAVGNRGGKLLVSAAAGSGKTKVLVDRLLSYLTDPVAPANLDEFLIITYTKAAAAELRGKIAEKLSDRIAAEPENRHIQQQMQRLYLAKISTVHALCADLLREYACYMEIAPDFRVADENECRQMRETAMRRILDAAYENAAEDPDFYSFVDSQGLGRDDRLVPDIVEAVYDSARCHMDSEGWLEKCVANGDLQHIQDAGQTPWGEFLICDLKACLRLQIDAMERCVFLAQKVPEFKKITVLLSDTIVQLKRLCECRSWDEVLARKDIDFGRLTFPKQHDSPELAGQIKAVRNRCKDSLGKTLRAFSEPSERILKDLSQTAGAVRGIVGLVRKFGAEYDRIKRGRHVLDFGDLEHKTLDLLLGSSHSGQTKIAREISLRFREVMVDEYQDTNAVQDAIFSALTQQKQNCFMVGDVKQSIYQFRLADPGIFLEKYQSYLPAEDAQAGQGRKILLSNNFRSGGAILSAVNDVFRQCMSPGVGGLQYGDQEALHEGFPHQPLGEPEVEFHAIDVQEDTYGEEASFVAERICQLLDGTHMVRQGEDLRPITAEDIVILLRYPGSVGQQFAAALEKKGIRCTSGGGQDLLQTAEIMTLCSLLRTISNPRQDIPLISTLASPVFGFTADDLALIRSKNRSGSFYDAILRDDSPKSLEFVQMIRQFREEARMHTLTYLLEAIFASTHLDSICGAMPEGRRREENLQTFFQLAADFEKNGKRDLYQFLEYLDAMEEKGIVSAGEQSNAGCVTIMSIHRSKGLEFPVVFLCGLARKFNREDIRAQVLCDRELGLGVSVMDDRNRVRYPTVAKRAIAVKKCGESLSEEMRVLYVAMTRARDRLIMTYADQRLDATLENIALLSGLCPREMLTREVNCPGEWILQAAMYRSEAGALFPNRGETQERRVSEYPWRISVDTARKTESLPQQAPPAETLPDATVERIAASLAFHYGHTAATLTPSKQTATQRKGREKDDEAAENTQETKPSVRVWRKPAFGGSGGKDYGNAVHRVMQYIRYEACTDEQAVRCELERLIEARFLTRQMAERINCGEIACFFATELGRKLQTGKNVLREFKFSILDEGQRYGSGLEGEYVLLQGVVDCALVEPDGITVLDFKTDSVTCETVAATAERYRLQVETYADALSRIFKSRVKEKLLYFFHLGRFISL